MAETNTVIGATKDLLKAIGYRIKNTKWWKTVLWVVGFVLAIGFLWSSVASIGEYEQRAAVIYGVIFLILLMLGIVAAFRKPHSTRAKK